MVEIPLYILFYDCACFQFETGICWFFFKLKFELSLKLLPEEDGLGCIKDRKEPK